MCQVRDSQRGHPDLPGCGYRLDLEDDGFTATVKEWRISFTAYLS